MAKARILSSNGRIKDQFDTPVHPDDEMTCSALLARRAHDLNLGRGARLQIKTRKGWRTYVL